jgi:hypothetical protein
MSYILVLLGLIVFIFLLLLITDRRRARAKNNFVTLAKKLQLNIDAPDGFLAKFPEIKGIYRNYPVRIFMFTEQEGEGKTKKIRVHTAIEVAVNNPIAYRLDIYEEGIMSMLNKYFGMQDVVIGKEKFDKEYIIKTNNEEITKKIFTDKICDELLYMANGRFGFGFEFGVKRIYYDEPKLLTSEKRILWLERILNVLIDIAEEFDKNKQ